MRILDLQGISIQPAIRSAALELTELSAGDELVAAVSWFPATSYRWQIDALPAGVTAEPIEHMLPEGADPEAFDEVLSHFRFHIQSDPAGSLRLRCARPERDYDPKALVVEISFIAEDEAEGDPPLVEATPVDADELA